MPFVTYNPNAKYYRNIRAYALTYHQRLLRQDFDIMRAFAAVTTTPSTAFVQTAIQVNERKHRTLKNTTAISVPLSHLQRLLRQDVATIRSLAALATTPSTAYLFATYIALMHERKKKISTIIMHNIKRLVYPLCDTPS